VNLALYVQQAAFDLFDKFVMAVYEVAEKRKVSLLRSSPAEIIVRGETLMHMIDLRPVGA
jgi:uncharacterized Fe-S cluster-containing radical SAM superfamily protein